MLLHPVALGSIALWLVNDHVLKRMTPSWLTGKLSDVACLIACPLLALAAVELARPQLSPRVRTTVLIAAIALFGAIMATLYGPEPVASYRTKTRTRGRSLIFLSAFR